METTPEAAPPPVAADAPGHHEEDPSNPHYFGLPIGVIIAAAISAAAVGITLLKFFWFS